MSIKTFWTILIKILGLWMVYRILTVLPELISNLYFIYENGDSKNLVVLFSSILIAILFFCLIIRTFLFKTLWIIEKLKLEKGFETETIEIQSNENKIIAIALIVIGGFIFIENLPILLREIAVFFHDKTQFKDYPKSGWIIFYLCKSVLGYLLMTNSFRVASFIKK
ncbi:hypothetical protein BD847_1028 [Flavobacterium cutihirudinis]|uniref:Uncharacterized protein n=1 Tax=Flavobacterium cutihirudinis TaxID=1265740 RepID=A0A3D9G1K8_9FLAO|nr:hypothetical protein [Flavobacterium cutihirudinis]RED27095.1 hypothetical protein BD847_1028 [Flavobacterium cutihirudinis]